MTTQPLLLYVEDDAIVAMVVQMALEDAGYSVDCHYSGSLALAALEQRRSDYAALVTDIRLPDLDGWKIARNAREISPGIPVTYVTGDSASDWPVLGVPGSLIIQKPFPNEQLVSAVAALIGN